MQSHNLYHFGVLGQEHPYLSLWGGRYFIWSISSNTSLDPASLHLGFGVHSLLRFSQTPKRSHVGYKPEVSGQILGGSFLLSRVPDSQACHRERLDEPACWGGRQQRQRSPRELSEGQQRRTQRKNRGDTEWHRFQARTTNLFAGHFWLKAKDSIRCQYFPFHLD